MKTLQGRAIMVFLLMMGLLFVAIFSRFYQLDFIPAGYSGHTITHAVTRVAFYEYLFVKEWSLRNFQSAFELLLKEQQAPHALFEALITPLFGFGFSENKRMVATTGIVIILCFFTLSRRLDRDPLFSFSVTLAAVSSPLLIIFSRYSDTEHTFAILYSLLLLIYVARFNRAQSTFHWFLLGALLGASLYNYATCQFLALLVLSCLILFKIFNPETKRIRNVGVKVCVLLLGLTIVSGPQMNFFVRHNKLVPLRSVMHGEHYSPRSVSQMLQGFFQAKDELFVSSKDPWFTKATGALEDSTLYLLVPGIIWLFRHRRSNSLLVFILASSLLLGIFPSVLTAEVPLRRMLIFYLAYIVVCGAGLFQILVFLRNHGGRISQSLGLLMVFSLVASNLSQSFNAIHPVETNFSRTFYSVSHYLLSAQSNGTSTIFVIDSELQFDSIQYAKTLWFGSLSSKSLISGSSVSAPIEYLTTSYLRRCSFKGAVIVPETYLDSFRETISECGQKTATQELAVVSDSVGPVFRIVEIT